MIYPNSVPAVILAGGNSRQFGDDQNAMAPMAGRVVIDHVIERLQPQCGPMGVNVTFGPLVDHITDNHPDITLLPEPYIWNDRGPQAGVRTALIWAFSLGAPCVLTVACNTPFLPLDLMCRLLGDMEGQDRFAAAVVQDPFWQPLFSLWRTEDDRALHKLWRDDPMLDSMVDLVEYFTAAHTPYPAAKDGEIDPFFNINTEDDLKTAEHWLARSADASDPSPSTPLSKSEGRG
ncbi:MAG: NTP transferase domain-containing protein [Pseudomonadota bacterium]